MSLGQLVADGLYLAVAFGGWVAYYRERKRSRDYVADLLSVVYRFDLGPADLRRATGWSEVDDRLAAWSRQKVRADEAEKTEDFDGESDT